MADLVSLSSLTVGSSAVLREFPKQGVAFLRLREMGMLPGTTLTLVRTAPLGDPIEIKVRGYSLTLRKSEADHVMVEPKRTLPPDPPPFRARRLPSSRSSAIRTAENPRSSTRSPASNRRWATTPV